MMHKWIKQASLTVSTVAILTLASTANAQDNSAQMSLSEAVSVGVMTNPEYGTVAASRRAT